MKTIIHKAGTRGHANHGWLDSWHTFSFAGYHNPDRVHFGLLRVLNDDVVAGGMGFGRHPHDNMEIVSIPLSGALSHKDSTGRSEVIKTNDVQIMSAGSGIVHSEMNASAKEPVNFLQIWVFPKERNIEPRYEQKTFNSSNRINNIEVVVSPNKEEGGVWINQDAWFSLSNPEEGKEINYKTHLSANGVYLFIIDGEVEMNGETFYKRDGIAVSETEEITLKANKNSSLLFIEVPLN